MINEKYTGNSTTPDEDKLLKYLEISDAKKLSTKIRERNILKCPGNNKRLSSTIDDFVQAIENAHSPEPIVKFSIDKDLEKEIQKAFESVEEEKESQEDEAIPTDEELAELLEKTLLKIDKEIDDLKNVT